MENHHRHSAEIDWAAMAELLDLQGEVLHSHLSEVTAWLGELAADSPRRRILDLGSGTGSGTLALAQRFSAADLIAVDAAGPLLARCEAKAHELGVARRVSTIQADLDSGWPAVDAVDLVWASMSLHHLADPDRVLGEVFGTLRPGGLLAVAEMGTPLRLLPDDVGIGSPGLEERCEAVLAGDLADALPHLGADWGSRLRDAGFTIVAERLFAVDLDSPLPAATARFAQASLRRLRSRLDGRLNVEDLATLDTLADGDGPDGVLRRDDLTVRTTRRVWVAMRP